MSSRDGIHWWGATASRGGYDPPIALVEIRVTEGQLRLIFSAERERLRDDGLVDGSKAVAILSVLPDIDRMSAQRRWGDMRTCSLFAGMLIAMVLGGCCEPRRSTDSTSTLVRSTQDEVAALEAEVSSLQAIARAMVPKLTTAEHDLATARAEVVRLTADRDRLAGSVTKGDADQADLNIRLAATERNLSRVTNDYEQAKQSLAKSVELLRLRDGENAALKAKFLAAPVTSSPP